MLLFNNSFVEQITLKNCNENVLTRYKLCGIVSSCTNYYFDLCIHFCSFHYRQQLTKIIKLFFIFSDNNILDDLVNSENQVNKR